MGGRPSHSKALASFSKCGKFVIACAAAIAIWATSDRAAADETSILRAQAIRFASPDNVFQPGSPRDEVEQVVGRDTFVPPALSPSPPALIPTPVQAVFVAPAEEINIGRVTMVAADPPPAPAADSNSAQTSQPGSFAQVEKLGDAPKYNTLEFLRQQAVLLKQGQCQFDWGVTYSVLDDRFSELKVNGSNVILANANERLRLLSIPFAVRYGLSDDVQAYLNAPLGWSNTEIDTDAGDSKTNNFAGVGDISGGVSYHFIKACGAYCPDVIGTVGFVAPSGHATFNSALVAPNSALGAGFWQITTNLLFVHTLDPVVFYYGGGYVHRFDATITDIRVDPGQEFDYLFGVGFAVNPWITLSGTMLGSYLTRFGANDVSIPGSDLDVIRFRMSVTVVKDQHICEPFAEIGMTADSPSRVGIVFTY